MAERTSQATTFDVEEWQALIAEMDALYSVSLYEAYDLFLKPYREYMEAKMNDIDPRYTDAMYNLIRDLGLNWLEVGNPNLRNDGNGFHLTYYAIDAQGPGQRSVKVPTELVRNFTQTYNEFPEVTVTSNKFKVGDVVVSAVTGDDPDIPGEVLGHTESGHLEVRWDCDEHSCIYSERELLFADNEKTRVLNDAKQAILVMEPFNDVVCNRDMLDGWLIAQADAIAAIEIEIERCEHDA